ncbi:hypothetical protein GN244_ATG05833 [Phytophthora infestans]|uniref:Uncharacterized protein n=1 Tax=Phytophthora infestans TaxID=4787 RepID=A0A833WHN7_PHYIN|nr:hypothetical protein GN244_ATG05833 [Phytophthora infestans]KAF4137563.1 hypothetical protein GN958_ATG13245 [Phytophthora infestans]
MAFSPLLQSFVRMGDALLGQLARVFVLSLGFLSPTMSKNISWDYNPEDVGPIVPEWGGPSASEKRDFRLAKFA